jgi:hypothetical protein
MHRVRRAPSRRLIAARDLVAARAIATAKESPRHKKEPYIRAVSLSPRGLGHASFRVKLAHWRMVGKRLHWDKRCRMRKSRSKWGNALVIRAVPRAWDLTSGSFPSGVITSRSAAGSRLLGPSPVRPSRRAQSSMRSESSAAKPAKLHRESIRRLRRQLTERVRLQ